MSENNRHLAIEIRELARRVRRETFDSEEMDLCLSMSKFSCLDDDAAILSAFLHLHGSEQLKDPSPPAAAEPTTVVAEALVPAAAAAVPSAATAPRCRAPICSPAPDVEDGDSTINHGPEQQQQQQSQQKNSVSERESSVECVAPKPPTFIDTLGAALLSSPKTAVASFFGKKRAENIELLLLEATDAVEHFDGAQVRVHSVWCGKIVSIIRILCVRAQSELGFFVRIDDQEAEEDELVELQQLALMLAHHLVHDVAGGVLFSLLHPDARTSLALLLIEFRHVFKGNAGALEAVSCLFARGGGCGQALLRAKLGQGSHCFCGRIASLLPIDSSHPRAADLEKLALHPVIQSLPVLLFALRLAMESLVVGCNNILGASLLHAATYAGIPDLCSIVLSSSSSSSSSQEALLSSRTNGGESVLAVAARGGSCSAVAWCVEHGMKMSERGPDGTSVTGYAALGGNVECAQFCARFGGGDVPSWLDGC